jgi:hypothetical protein
MASHTKQAADEVTSLVDVVRDGSIDLFILSINRKNNFLVLVMVKAGWSLETPFGNISLGYW